MSAFSKFSDQELTALLQKGDPSAFAEIYERYWGVLYIHALKMLRDEDEVKDVLQELFSSLWAKAAGLQLSTSLSSYLYAAVRNKVFNLIEHQKIKRNYSASIIQFSQQGDYVTDELLRINELKQLIEKEVMKLPSKMREVFELSRNSYLSHKEIAEQLGISDKTVRKQINNAIKILRLRLSVTIGLPLLLLLLRK